MPHVGKQFLSMLVLCSATLWWACFTGATTGGHHLFAIENSNSEKFVQYDIRPIEEGNPSSEPPIVAYWILEDGETKELTTIQRLLAYGIDSQKRLGEDLYEMVLTAFKDRRITIRKIDGGYKAFAMIDGRECVLERIYVEAKEGVIGLPKVLFVDIFGRDSQTDLPVTERLLPDSKGSGRSRLEDEIGAR